MSRGFINFRVAINLRWFLRPLCHAGHDWQYVGSIHPLMGGNYNYCKRCGWGWRTDGLEHTPRFCRHRWETEGEPSTTISTGEPFRQIERCPRCRKHRCIECATGKVVA